MIVARVTHGLGNQLYQYAAARSLADREGEELRLDLSFFRDPRRDRASWAHALLSRVFPSKGAPRDLGLLRFRIRAAPAGTLQLARHGFIGFPKFHRALHRLRLLPGNLMRESREGGFDRHRPGAFNYLEGFWQSPGYFEWNRERILEDLTLKAPPSGRNLRLLERIQSRPSLCLHVRLGDVAESDSRASARFGTQGLGYYREAMKRMLRRKPKAPCFLFSDEPARAASLLGLSRKATVVDHNGNAPHEDLRLMSACRYFVIPNSTFSWWAAWLSPGPSKVVIAPAQWIPAQGKDHRPDRIPSAWIRL